MLRRKRFQLEGNSEKRIPWRSQEVKEAIQTKKDTFKALLQDRSSSNLQPRYNWDSKSSNFGSKEIYLSRSHEKSLVVGWIPAIFRPTKYFCRTFAVYVASNLRLSLAPPKTLRVTFSRMNPFTIEEILLRSFESYKSIGGQVNAKC